MGNFLVTAVNPCSVEDFLGDNQEIIKESSLGSTCFMKVANARYREGLVVVKVFPCSDLYVPLTKYQSKIEDIKRMLTNVPNCLPFKRAKIIDKGGILIRQYIHYNLYDRISTRPFLNSIEKRWIAFQMLYALSQSHRSGVCHGDIKLENILVTGWNWVVLTDFASFKPTYLQENNPAHYNYFFDTSRRRTCYIGPERFVKDTSRDANSCIIEEELEKGELVPSMDIFSMGCALIELFTEGQAPFDLEHLLKYNSSEEPPPLLVKILSKIDDPNIRELVTHMIQKDPTRRHSAASYLEEQKGKAFPEYFYDFLKDYLTDFAVTPDFSPDEKVAKIHWDIKNIIAKIKEPGDDSSQHQPGLVIIVTLLTSCLRSLHHCSAKLHALEALQALAPHLAPELILDRLLPYLLDMVKDPYPRVKVAVVKILADVLDRVEQPPQSDANIFPEYILGFLHNLSMDDSVCVRVAFSECLASIVDSARRFLEKSQLMLHSQQGCNQHDSLPFSKDGETHANVPESSMETYDRELRAMQNMIQQSVSTLLGDSNTTVKQTVLGKSIHMLCTFFGPQKTHDVILSHAFTFLNDKEDWYLRKAFFDNIDRVVYYLGFQCCPILMPLLSQGLRDTEEFVVYKALQALSNLALLHLMQKQITFDVLPYVTPLLCHPNLWIRHGAVGFIHSIGNRLHMADICQKLVPHLKKYMDISIGYVNRKDVLLKVLKPPVPRSIFNLLVTQTQLKELVFSLLEHTRVHKHPRSSFIKNLTPYQHQILKRYESENPTEETEMAILAMREYLNKYVSKPRIEKEQAGYIEVDDINGIENDKMYFFNFHVDNCLTYDTSTQIIRPESDWKNEAFFFKPPSDRSRDRRSTRSHNIKSRKQGRRKQGAAEQTTMNEDWQNLFGAVPTTTDSPKIGPASIASTDSAASLSPQPSPALELPPLPPPDNFTPYKVSTKVHCVPCQEELLTLVHQKYEEFYQNQLCQDEISMEEQPIVTEPSWRPQGIQVANIQEHRAAINQIQAIPHSSVFATCSADSTIKLWDCSKSEAKSIYNRSSHTYSSLTGDIICMASAYSGYLAAASDTREVHVIKLDANPIAPLHTKTMSSSDGFVVDMKYLGSGYKQVLSLATLQGKLIGWDLRAQPEAWRLTHDLSKGYITSMVVDPSRCWMVTSTSLGHLISWDLRFLLPVTQMKYSAETYIHKVLLHPHHQSEVFASAHGNNEVSLWNIDTGLLDLTLWASNTPPFSRTQTEPDSPSVRSMVYMGYGGSDSYLLTGGSDSKVRLWELDHPDKSKILVPSGHPEPSGLPPIYSSKIVDANKLVQEIVPTGIREEVPPRYPEAPPQGHYTTITDMSVVSGYQMLLATASGDGFLKLWK